MAEVTLSSTTVARLHQAAQEKGTTAEELAEQAIRRFLRETRRDRMQQELLAFQAMHPRLLGQYPGQFVAVYQGQIVDHDANQLDLLARMEERYPDAPVLIQQVLDTPQETYTFRSPRIAGST